uniref:Saposin B-type domain-containing protein n=1 Tax=Chelydra serpentina TaxID=8475 RepID=A0A8C3XRC7_CHESE
GHFCGDCVKLVADIQEKMRTGPFFTESLVATAKQLCEHLGPNMADGSASIPFLLFHVDRMFVAGFVLNENAEQCP